MARGDGGNYKLELFNKSGSTPAQFGLKVLAPPAAPGGPLGVSDITKSQCRLSWRPPRDDGGARVNNYVVERKEIGRDRDYWLTVASACKDTTFLCQGLNEGKEYVFRIAAVNDVGTSEYLQAENNVLAKMPFGIQYEHINLFYSRYSYSVRVYIFLLCFISMTINFRNCTIFHLLLHCIL